MGRFNDLPKDVIWLICRQFLWSSYPLSYGFDRLEIGGCFFSNMWDLSIVNEIVLLACINHRVLSVVRSKTLRDTPGDRMCEIRGWWFVKGALTLT